MFQKGHDHRLYRYTAPESQVGIATLSLPDGIMWMYMPAFGKPKKITLLAKSQAFSGTDFSYEDMSVSSYADNYTHTLIEEKDGEYVIEMEPVNEKSSYSKIVLYLNKDQFTPRKMEYYDRGGTKFKEASYVYVSSGNYLYAERVIMANLKKQHMTKIEITDVVFDQGLSDDLFLVENLVPVE
jgi:outer membrane lipoprotein-sorting protein